MLNFLPKWHKYTPKAQEKAKNPNHILLLAMIGEPQSHICNAAYPGFEPGLTMLVSFIVGQCHPLSVLWET